MRESWRIQINITEDTKLVTHGLYKYSRNPIYLGLLISFLGFFMIAPNALSLCFLILMLSSIGIKIRLEEEHLIRKHPGDFMEYKNNVRRWV